MNLSYGGGAVLEDLGATRFSRVIMVDLGQCWGGQEVYSANILKAILEAGGEAVSVSPQEQYSECVRRHVSVRGSLFDLPRIARLVVRESDHNCLVHLNGNRAIFLAPLIRFLGGWQLPIVATKHTLLFSGGVLGSKLRECLSALALFFCFVFIDRIIVVSEAIVSQVPRVMRNKVSFVVNGVADVFSGTEVVSQRQIRFRSKKLRIGYIGRLAPGKGIETFLELIQLLLYEPSFQFEFSIIGTGPHASFVAQWVERHKTERVDFLGFQTDVAPFLEGFDIFVCPSECEATSLSLLEALSAGCLVVAFDIPGNCGVISHGENGLLVRLADGAEGMRRTIMKFLADETVVESLLANARKSYCTRFTLEQCTVATIRVYQQALDKIH